MNYAPQHNLLFQFFIKVAVNIIQAYSFLLIGMMYLQLKKNITFS